LVLSLLNYRWEACVPYLQLLCVAGLLYPVHLMNLNVLQAVGRSDLFLRLGILKKVAVVINIAITWRWGISAMICGMVVTSITDYYLNSYYTGTLIGYSIKEQLRDMSPYFIVSVLMGVVAYAVKYLYFSHHLYLMVAQITTGFIVYIGLCRAFRLKAFMEILEAASNKIRTLGYRVPGIQGIKPDD